MLADAILIVHAAFVLFVIAGGLLVWRWPRVAWAHVPAALWGAGIEFVGGVCPLTPLESRLRVETGGAAAPTGDFVERMIEPLLYPGWLTRELQILIGAIVVVVNVGVYVAVWRRRSDKMGSR